jgi:hypothetical protein
MAPRTLRSDRQRGCAACGGRADPVCKTTRGQPVSPRPVKRATHPSTSARTSPPSLHFCCHPRRVSSPARSCRSTLPCHPRTGPRGSRRHCQLAVALAVPRSRTLARPPWDSPRGTVLLALRRAAGPGSHAGRVVLAKCHGSMPGSGPHRGRTAWRHALMMHRPAGASLKTDPLVTPGWAGVGRGLRGGSTRCADKCLAARVGP